jgi:hypothetical protein
VKRSVSSDYHVWWHLHDGFVYGTAGIVSTYGIATFSPKLSLQDRVKAMKAKMNELMLARDNQVITHDSIQYV